ncbi:DUF3486 family protein [uncultured Kiloniella sp.]|uniref:DUF3486 family protein n=1 Tax=uncultured Kiloniella sp. TaxID=1133091 RepID=UPI0026285A80|nr:DUF3486 family protein [uncultured Kiloniella sp.]
MPPRSKVEALPSDVREDLERQLVQNSFSKYRELSEWLAEQGFQISKSSLHSYGQNFEERLGSLKRVSEQARVVVSENPDDDGAVNDALIRLVQEKAFTLLLEMEVDAKDVNLPKLMKVIADLSRASVSQKRLASEVRQQAREEAAKIATNAARQNGFTEDQAAFIRAEILGVKIQDE